MQLIPSANQLTIQLEGMEGLWALKRRLQIPHYAIEAMSYDNGHPTLQTLRGYFRIPGTSVPFAFKAGTFRRQGKREFWYLRFGQPGVLTIELVPGVLKYDSVRLTCSPQTAEDAMAWWQAQRAS